MGHPVETLGPLVPIDRAYCCASSRVHKGGCKNFPKGAESESLVYTSSPVGSRGKSQVVDLGTKSPRSWRLMLNYCKNFDVNGRRILQIHGFSGWRSNSYIATKFVEGLHKTGGPQPSLKPPMAAEASFASLKGWH